MLEGRSKRGEVFSWGTVRLRVDSGARVVAVSRGKDRKYFRELQGFGGVFMRQGKKKNKNAMCLSHHVGSMMTSLAIVMVYHDKHLYIGH